MHDKTGGPGSDVQGRKPLVLRKSFVAQATKIMRIFGKNRTGGAERLHYAVKYGKNLVSLHVLFSKHVPVSVHRGSMGRLQ